MKVYRYEGPDGIGPYSNSILRAYRDLGFYYHDGPDYPNWEEDGISVSPRRDYRTACESIDKLHEWFTEEEQAVLLKEGYIIKEYDVLEDNVIYGKSGKQLVFKIS